jgi:ssDNA-binding replication factor A large subunit
MNPFLIALTAFSTLDSMQSASRQAALIEQQAKADAANARLRGLETHNARLRNLDVALSTNNAIAGFTGRSDRSIDAINRRLREDASTDVARNAQNTIANIAASNLEANVARMRGQNKQRAILLDGLSSGYVNYLRFKDVT